MNLARAFAYCRRIEVELEETTLGNEQVVADIRAEREREVSALERRLEAQHADFLDWSSQDLQEISRLRTSYTELLDRVTEKLKLTPMSEPMHKEPLTAE